VLNYGVEMLNLTSLILLACLLAVDADGPTKMINIGYAVRGYDSFTGNPQSNGIDRGFKHPVFDLEYTQKTTTGDGRYLVPDNMNIYVGHECGAVTRSEEIKSTKDYLHSLAADFGTTAGDILGTAAFTLSADYQKLKTKISMDHEKFVTTAARCIVYEASAEWKYGKIKLAGEFVDAVNSLPSTKNEDEYRGFIAHFGTHFVTKMFMGAKLVDRSEFTETSWTEVTSKVKNMQAAAGGSFNVAHLNISGQIHTVDKDTETFNGLRENVETYQVGSFPANRNQSMDDWASLCKNDPSPMEYEIAKIAELFTKKRFPSVADIETKRNLLTDVINQYTNRTVIEDRDDFERVTLDFKYSASVSCKSGYQLLSCGLHDAVYDTKITSNSKPGIQTTGKEDTFPYRHVYPVDTYNWKGVKNKTAIAYFASYL